MYQGPSPLAPWGDDSEVSWAKLQPPIVVADPITCLGPLSFSCISSPLPHWCPRHLPNELPAYVWLFWNHLGVISTETGLPKNTPGVGTSVTGGDRGRTGVGLTHAAALKLTLTFENSTTVALVLTLVTPGDCSATHVGRKMLVRVKVSPRKFTARSCGLETSGDAKGRNQDSDQGP